MQQPIRVSQEFNKSKEEVWRAITELDQMIQWYFNNIPAFKPEVGFKTDFPVQSEERTFHHLWEILEVVPNQLIKYSWRYKEYPGEGVVTFSLEDAGAGKTLLTVINEGLESFPDNIPEFKPESCRAGWEYFIQGNLKDYLSEN